MNRIVKIGMDVHSTNYTLLYNQRDYFARNPSFTESPMDSERSIMNL